MNWWRRSSLRFRLAVWYALVGSLLLAGFSATLYVYVANRMARPLDHQLRRDLADIGRRLEVSADGSVRWNGRVVAENAPWTTQYPWFELWDDNGTLIRRLWPFAENRVQQTPGPPAPGRDTISVFSVAPDLRLRVLSVPLTVPGRGGEWMIRVMRVHEPVGDALGALRWIIIIALPVVVALLVFGGYSITQHWLMPLARLTTEANRITPDELGRRLTVENPSDEVGRLATVFNDTLDRLQSSFDALDRFVADASHELRTPLTTLRSVGEVGLRRSRSVEEYREIIGSMLEEAQRLQHLIGRLLELASAEGGTPDLHRVDLSVDDYVRQCANDLAILAETRGQRLTVNTVPCRTTTDPVLFRQALQNLIDNAIKYAPERSTITVDVRVVSEDIVVSVTDEGPGISADHQVNLAKRFFRPDRGRDRARGGFGLGLSLTKAYMRVLGGSFAYEPGQPTGSVFRLKLPGSRA